MSRGISEKGERADEELKDELKHNHHYHQHQEEVPELIVSYEQREMGGAGNQPKGGGKSLGKKK